jgi:hypothetical protein
MFRGLVSRTRAVAVKSAAFLKRKGNLALVLLGMALAVGFVPAAHAQTSTGVSVTYPGDVIDPASLGTVLRTEGGRVYKEVIAVMLAFFFLGLIIVYMRRAARSR